MKHSKKHVNKYKSSTNDMPMEELPKDYKHGKNLYRMCLSKRKFKTKEYAEKAAEYNTKKYGVQQYVYYCPYCFNYHLTTIPR